MDGTEYQTHTVSFIQQPCMFGYAQFAIKGIQLTVKGDQSEESEESQKAKENT